MYVCYCGLCVCVTVIVCVWFVCYCGVCVCLIFFFFLQAFKTERNKVD